MPTDVAAEDASRAPRASAERSPAPPGQPSPPPRGWSTLRGRAFLARALGATSIRYRIALAAAGAVFVACLLTTLVGYLVERQNIIRSIDSRLAAAAAAVPHMLPPGYHDRIFDALATRPEPGADTRPGTRPDAGVQRTIREVAADESLQAEYRAVVGILNDYVDRAELPYVYTYIIRDGNVYLTSANQPLDRRASGEFYPFLMHETQPPPGVVDVIADGRPTFVDYTTRSGSFRSIFAPVGATPDRRYVISADVTLDFMRASLMQRLVQALLIALIVSVAVGTGAAWLAGRLTRPVGRLAHALDTLGAGARPEARFASDAGGDLADIAGRHDETGRLARSMLAMQDRLALYVRKLDIAARAQQRMTTQLEIARRIQQGLLPQEPPQLSKLTVVGWSQAAEHVGGDFYDWLEAPCPGSEAICILADAAGHGVAAALTAATCRAHARDLLRHCHDSLADGLAELSDVVGADAADGNFLTLFAAVVTGEQVRIASAGHGPILICRADGSIEQVDATGPPLGVVTGARYAPDQLVTLAPGETLLVVSDGIFEAPTRDGVERFGIARLKAVLGDCSARSCQQVVERLRDEVHAFTGGAEPADDMTVLVLGRRAE